MQILVLGDLDAQGLMMTLGAFSMLDLDVINCRGASTLVVAHNSIPLVKEVLDAAAIASPLEPLPEIKGVDSMAELLPLAFPSQFAAWQQQQQQQQQQVEQESTTTTTQPQSQNEPDQIAEPVQKKTRL